VKEMHMHTEDAEESPSSQTSSASVDNPDSSDAVPTDSLLAPLAVGDRLPWRFDADGEPQWLTVVECLPGSAYLVRYPDGRVETLIDSE
jgi:hypothetical protein